MLCSAWAACLLAASAQELAKSAADRASPAVAGASENGTPGQAAGMVTGYRGHYACRFFSGKARELAIAASDLDTEAFAQLLQTGADVHARVESPAGQGMTMLQVAVSFAWQLESIQLLLDAGADLDARDRRGDTALIIACRNPAGVHLPVVTALLRAGAKVDDRGSGGMTPLMCAALCDDTGQAVRTLLEASADVRARDNRGWTAPMHATCRRREHLEIVQLLVQAGSDVNARHKYGGTALSNAAYNGHTKSVQFFIQHGVQVNASDSAGWTPLIGSSMNGHAQVVQALVDAGADINVTDRLGRTALSVARSGGQTSVQELLVRRGAR